MKKFSEIKGTFMTMAVYLGILGGIFLGVRGCNAAFNNRTIDNPTHHTESRAIGLAGHIEYTKYADGSQDVKIYPWFGHRLIGSELHQDLDGDNVIDRIRRNGPEWKMNRLIEVLVKEEDYVTNKERFDKASKQLQELSSGNFR